MVENKIVSLNTLNKKLNAVLNLLKNNKVNNKVNTKEKKVYGTGWNSNLGSMENESEIKTNAENNNENININQVRKLNLVNIASSYGISIKKNEINNILVNSKGMNNTEYKNYIKQIINKKVREEDGNEDGNEENNHSNNYKNVVVGNKINFLSSSGEKFQNKIVSQVVNNPNGTRRIRTNNGKVVAKDKLNTIKIKK
jgi:hypothetical protein